MIVASIFLGRKEINGCNFEGTVINSEDFCGKYYDPSDEDFAGDNKTKFPVIY